jgi:hypothetical protein
VESSRGVAEILPDRGEMAKFHPMAMKMVIKFEGNIVEVLN